MNNMNKLWPDGRVHKREDGKVIKPEGFEKVELKTLFQ
jgi:predicted HAD superfamily Cof-like phosphohydrolase